MFLIGCQKGSSGKTNPDFGIIPPLAEISISKIISRSKSISCSATPHDITQHGSASVPSSVVQHQSGCSKKPNAKSSPIFAMPPSWGPAKRAIQLLSTSWLKRKEVLNPYEQRNNSFTNVERDLAVFLRTGRNHSSAPRNPRLIRAITPRNPCWRVIPSTDARPK